MPSQPEKSYTLELSGSERRVLELALCGCRLSADDTDIAGEIRGRLERAHAVVPRERWEASA